MSIHQPTTPPSLERAYYGIGPVDAVKRAYLKYATFNGRASRGEYWWFVLFAFVLYLVLGAGAGILGNATSQDSGDLGPAAVPFVILLCIFVLGSIVPAIALTVRRLHDAGYSGLLYLINFVPYLGSLILCVFLAMRASPAGDKYDPGAVTGYGAFGQYGYPTPYGQPGYPPPTYGQADPYAQPVYGQADPYAQPGYSQTDPYVQPGYGRADPYAPPPSMGQTDPYRQYPQSQNDAGKPNP